MGIIIQLFWRGYGNLSMRSTAIPRAVKRSVPLPDVDKITLVSWHVCYKALEAFFGDFCPFILQGLAELSNALGHVFHTDDFTAQFIPNLFHGVAVWRSCRLLNLGDGALLKEINDYPSTVRCGVIVSVDIAIPWNAAWEIALRCFVKCFYRANQRGICRKT